MALFQRQPSDDLTRMSQFEIYITIALRILYLRVAIGRS